MRGVKELLLFPPSQAHALPLTAKYDPGARLCAVDVTRIADGGGAAEAAAAGARGWHVRLEAGDTLYIPKGTFHAVVALSPSLSISSFGHAPLELVTNGLLIELRDALHRAGLLRWGDCSCHGAGTPRPRAAAAAVAAAAASIAFLLAWRSSSSSR